MTDVFSQLFSPAADGERFYGLCIGVVTNNKDPEGLGRVKVQFPWLSAGSESAWARLVTPMAGAKRGLYFLPEVDDEVLVGFDQGLMEAPYVLGGLWNGKDKPPQQNGDGRNNIRAITSRSGHTIRLDDTAGGEKIEIVDKSGQNQIVIDTKTNAVNIDAGMNITIKSGNGRISLEGMEVSVKASTQMKLESSGVMMIKGSGLVKVNGGLVTIN